MRRLIASTLRAVARRIDPPPEPPQTRADVGWADLSSRQDDALALIDDDVRGYVQLIVRGYGPGAFIEPRLALTDDMWPAVCVTLGRVLAEGRQVFR